MAGLSNEIALSQREWLTECLVTAAFDQERTFNVEPDQVGCHARAVEYVPYRQTGCGGVTLGLSLTKGLGLIALAIE
jgi:hypothetical protein